MRVSVIIRGRNEYPIVLGTIHSFLEDLEFHGYDCEFIVVDNLSTDFMLECLMDKYRRWTRNGTLKLVKYSEKASTWCAINEGFRVATGDIIVVADAHVSVKIGTMKLLIDGALEHGGLWFPAMQLWGDTERIKRYGFDLRLNERFWGDACPHLPPGEDGQSPYKIAMAGACLFVTKRQSVEGYGLFHRGFKAYGGGEPYICLKWWMLGSSCWIHPQALVRHAFGIEHAWVKAPGDRRMRNAVYQRDGSIGRSVKKGTEYLSYRPGYSVPNEEFYFNFLLAAFILGGHQWLSHMWLTWAQPKLRKIRGHEKIVQEVEAVGRDSRQELEERSARSLNDLLLAPPWKMCNKHEMVLPPFLKVE